MSDYITLLGAEDVSRAGHNMQGAAERMSSVVSNLEGVLERHERWMDDWLMRLEQVFDKQKGGSE